MRGLLVVLAVAIVACGQARSASAGYDQSGCTIPPVGIDENGVVEFMAVPGESAFAPGEVQRRFKKPEDNLGFQGQHYEGCSGSLRYQYDDYPQEDDPTSGWIGPYQTRCRSGVCELGQIIAKMAEGDASLSFGLHIEPKGMKLCQINGPSAWKLSVTSSRRTVDVSSKNVGAASCFDEETSRELLVVMREGASLEATDDKGAVLTGLVADLEEAIRFAEFLKRPF